jgi:hypothetical protein
MAQEQFVSFAAGEAMGRSDAARRSPKIPLSGAELQPRPNFAFSP